MKSLGIIAEFNPFHRGHQYLIERARAETGADICVAVMSGDFVQRGEPAFADKWERARQAVCGLGDGGADLVVELPTVYAVSSAPEFARGGVEVLEGFGCVDVLAFGSESGDLTALQEASACLTTHRAEMDRRIRALRKEGCTYPRARQQALADMGVAMDETLITAPNNILALEYLQQVRTMTPFTVKRSDKGHHPTASRIRAAQAAADPERYAARAQTYWKLVSAGILQTDAAQLDDLQAAGEGLGNRLKQAVRYADSAEALIRQVKSKAYTYSRISRLLTQILLGLDRQAVAAATPYIRVLAFNARGAAFLREVQDRGCATLPVLTNINQGLRRWPQLRPTLEKDILAADLYHLICGTDLYRNADLVHGPERAE